MAAISSGGYVGSMEHLRALSRHVQSVFASGYVSRTPGSIDVKSTLDAAQLPSTVRDLVFVVYEYPNEEPVY